MTTALVPGSNAGPVRGSHPGSVLVRRFCEADQDKEFDRGHDGVQAAEQWGEYRPYDGAYLVRIKGRKKDR